jgi:hypothetical protein
MLVSRLLDQPEQQQTCFSSWISTHLFTDMRLFVSLVWFLIASALNAQVISETVTAQSTDGGVTWNLHIPDYLGSTNSSHLAMSSELSIISSNTVASNLSSTNLTSLASWSAYTNMIAQIPAGISDTSNRIVTLTGLQSSINSGTNSQAQLNSIMAQMASQIKFTYVYLSNLIVLRSYEQTLFSK